MGRKDVFEGATVAVDAVGDVWAESAVVRDGGGRDFYFLGHVVDLEEQAEGGPEVLTGVSAADKDFVACSEVWDVVDPNVSTEFLETVTVARFDGRGGG